MREPKLYREVIESLNLFFPKQNHLHIKDVAEYEGVSINTAKSRYPFIKRDKSGAGCTKQELAMAIAERKKL